MPTPSPTFGEPLALWDAVYNQDTALAQKLLASPAGIAQVNRPHGVRREAIPRSRRSPWMVDRLGLQLWQETSVHVAVRRGNAKLLSHLLFSSGDANARSVRS